MTLNDSDRIISAQLRRRDERFLEHVFLINCGCGRLPLLPENILSYRAFN